MSQESRPEKRIDLTTSFPLQPQFNLGDTYTVSPRMYEPDDIWHFENDADPRQAMDQANLRTQHFADIFTHVTEHPDLLVDMPYFPDTLENIPADKQSELELAAQRFGFVNLSEIYEVAKFDLVFRKNKNKAVEDAFIIIGRTQTWAQLLTIFRFDMMTQGYGRAMVEQVYDVFGNIMPAFIAPIPKLEFAAIKPPAQYFHKVRLIQHNVDRLKDTLDYYVAADRWRNIAYQISKVRDMAHELIHHGHNFQLGSGYGGEGTADFVTEGLASVGELAYLKHMVNHTTGETRELFEKEYLEKLSSMRKVRRLIRLERAAKILEPARNARDIIERGRANRISERAGEFHRMLRDGMRDIYMTIYINQAKYRKRIDSSDTLFDKLIDEDSEEYELLQAFADQQVDTYDVGREYEYGAFDLMKPLLDRVGWEALMVGNAEHRAMVLDINLLRTELAKNVNELLADPRLLPGLKGNPLVPTDPLTEREKNRRLVGEKLPKGYM